MIPETEPVDTTLRENTRIQSFSQFFLDFGSGKSTNWYCIVPHGKKALPGREQAEKLGLTPHDRFPPSCTLKSPVLLRPRKHEMHYWGLHEAKIDSTNS